MSVETSSAAARTARPKRVARWQKAARDNWLAVAVFVVLLVVWEWVVESGRVPRFLLPSPSDIWTQFRADLPLLIAHGRITLMEIVIGYLTAAVLGIVVALAVVRWRVVEQVVFPYLVGSQTIPKIAIAPLIIIWLGTGWLPKILMVALIAFFPIAINTIAGFRAVEQKYITLCESVAATEQQVFRKVRFPYAVPFIFAGLKVATTLSVLGAIVAEWVGASQGLGYLILSGNYNFETGRVFVGLIALIVMGIIFFWLISTLERVLSWRSGTGQTVQGGEGF